MITHEHRQEVGRLHSSASSRDALRVQTEPQGDGQKLPLHGAPRNDRGITHDDAYACCLAVITASNGGALAVDDHWTSVCTSGAGDRGARFAAINFATAADSLIPGRLSNR
jgi:hypothetical protein